jgi:hypothetical protein
MAGGSFRSKGCSRVTAARLALLAVLVLSLGGCPFTSSRPLSDPAAARPDSRIFGTWRTQDPETGEWNALTILPFNDSEMVGFALDRTKGTVDAFRVFPTAIAGESFLNFQQLGGQDEGWYFARYQVDGDELRMKIVDDGLFEKRQFASSADLREFVRQHLSDPLLYASDADQPVESVWERAPEPSGEEKSKS